MLDLFVAFSHEDPEFLVTLTVDLPDNGEAFFKEGHMMMAGGITSSVSIHLRLDC